MMNKEFKASLFLPRLFGRASSRSSDGTIFSPSVTKTQIFYKFAPLSKIGRGVAIESSMSDPCQSLDGKILHSLFCSGLDVGYREFVTVPLGSFSTIRLTASQDHSAYEQVGCIHPWKHCRI
jgi:hypothetical protein